jgi:activating signal cointegrator 1
MNMKAISLWEPWSTAIAMGYKKVETRHWYTSYRGWLLICSAKNLKAVANFCHLQQEGYFPDLRFSDLNFGKAVAVCKLKGCVKMTEEFIDRQTEAERLFGDWQPGRFAWILEDVNAIEPFPVTGKQGLWDVDKEATALIRRG